MKVNVTIEMIDMDEVKHYTERTRSITVECGEDVNEYDIADHVCEHITDYITFSVLDKLERFFTDISYVNDFVTSDKLYTDLLEVVKQL